MTASDWTGRTAALAVLLLAALGGCSNNDNNHHDILPLKASLSPLTVPAGPVVYLRVASGDVAGDDLVPLEIVLRAGGSPLSFDAFDVEMHLENPSQPGVPAPGILQFIFDAGANQKTPFGPCGGSTTCTARGKCDGNGPTCTSAADCTSGVCVTSYSCDSTVTCNACLSCPADPTFSAAISNPLCLSNVAGANTDVLLGVSSIPNASCPQTRTVPVNGEVVLAHIGLLAAAEGSVRLVFVTKPDPARGDCEILAYGAPGSQPTDLDIKFDDGGATFTAHR